MTFSIKSENPSETVSLELGNKIITLKALAEPREWVQGLAGSVIAHLEEKQVVLHGLLPPYEDPLLFVVQSSERNDQVLVFTRLALYVLNNNGDIEIRFDTAGPEATLDTSYGDPETIEVQDKIAIINPDSVVVLDSGLRLVLFKRKYVSDNYSHNANNILFFQKYDESIFSLDLNGLPNW